MVIPGLQMADESGGSFLAEGGFGVADEAETGESAIEEVVGGHDSGGDIVADDTDHAGVPDASGDVDDGDVAGGGGFGEFVIDEGANDPVALPKADLFDEFSPFSVEEGDAPTGVGMNPATDAVEDSGAVAVEGVDHEADLLLFAR